MVNQKSLSRRESIPNTRRNSEPNVQLSSLYLSAARELIERSGFRFTIERDLAGWVDHMRQAAGVKFIMPTFNPLTHPFEDDPVWVRVTLPDKETPVACMAARCFTTDDYHELLASGVLWYTDGRRQPGFLLKNRGPSGRVSHVGGLWVDPRNRGDGFSWIVPRLLAAVTFQSWGQQFHTGLVQEGLVRRDLPAKNYGVGSMELCIDGWFGPTDKQERIYSAVTTQRQLLERMAVDLDQILREHDKKVRDHAPVVRQRYN